MSRYNRLKDSVTVAPVFPPPVASVFEVFWRDNRRKIGGGGVALDLPGVSREIFLPKTDRARRWRRSYQCGQSRRATAPVILV